MGASQPKRLSEALDLCVHFMMQLEDDISGWMQEARVGPAIPSRSVLAEVPIRCQVGADAIRVGTKGDCHLLCYRDAMKGEHSFIVWSEFLVRMAKMRSSILSAEEVKELEIKPGDPVAP